MQRHLRSETAEMPRFGQSRQAYGASGGQSGRIQRSSGEGRRQRVKAGLPGGLVLTDSWEFVARSERKTS